MRKILLSIFLSHLLILLCPPQADAGGSYYLMGDGEIRIGSGYKGRLERIVFRVRDGTYIHEGLKRINHLYGADWARPEMRMSVRLIEILDHLEDHFKGRGIHIVSGHRDPDYNQSLRDRGALAASSSLHIDAEAIDVVMGGVESAVIFEYLVPKNCCGVGYYHGKTVHIDSGPPRFWDELTSGAEKREPPENRYITIKTERDIYKSGGGCELKFSRVNNYPIGVKKEMTITCGQGDKKIRKKIYPQFQPTTRPGKKGCLILKNRKEGRMISAGLPRFDPKYGTATCQVRAHFCGPRPPKMPGRINSNVFTVLSSER